MALSPRPCPALLALLALVALVAPRGTLVASQRPMCHMSVPPEPLLTWGVHEHGAMVVTNGGPWGQWGHAEFCPPGSFAVGLQLKVQPYQGFFGDDTGLNGVRLLCDTGTHTVTSSEGPLGEWQPPLRCPPGQRPVSFQLRAEPPQGLWDDTAANDVAVLCSEGVFRRQAGGLPRGEWGSWSQRCEPPCGVCGLRTRLEPPHDSDSSGLNDLQLYCCAL